MGSEGKNKYRIHGIGSKTPILTCLAFCKSGKLGAKLYNAGMGHDYSFLEI